MAETKFNLMTDLCERVFDLCANYPVCAHHDEIIDTVSKNPTTIISAATGTGKSTIVPIIMLLAGYDRIVLAVETQSAALGIANRIAYLTGTELGTLVGYQTAYVRQYDNEKTRIFVATNGVELMRQLHNNSFARKNSVLIIDEIQEWSLNIEALVGWAKMELMNGWDSKVILMSAYTDTNALAQFFNAPCLDIQGRFFSVEKIQRKTADFLDTIEAEAAQGNSVLAFVSGKREIEETINSLTKRGVNAHFFSLHGDMTLVDQQRALAENYDSIPKIVVSTNVAQTSLTIPGINVVVDSGFERRRENVEGIFTLVVGTITKSDVVQRSGRAGRTAPGRYYFCNDKRFDELKEFPIADIYTGDIAQIVLRLASINVDARDIDFYHKPELERILAAQKTLRTLGAFDNNNEITDVGLIMSKLPLSVQYARMIVEAEKRGVLDEVITIAAISEIGGIKQSGVPYHFFTKEIKSDLLADFDCFNFVSERMKKYSYSDINPFENVIERNYYRVLELRTKLYDILENIYGSFSSSGKREEIMKSCAAGLVEYLYVRESNGWYTCPSDSYKRKLNLYSSTLPGKYILGIPCNISLKYKGETGQQTLYLIGSALMTDIPMLKEIAPHLLNVTERDYFDFDENKVIHEVSERFGEVVINTTSQAVRNSDEIKLFVDWLTKMTFKEERNEDFNKLPGKLKIILNANERSMTRQDVPKFYNERLRYQKHLPNLKKPKSLDLIKF